MSVCVCVLVVGAICKIPWGLVGVLLGHISKIRALRLERGCVVEVVVVVGCVQVQLRPDDDTWTVTTRPLLAVHRVLVGTDVVIGSRKMAGRTAFVATYIFG
jgi:hypothetical protein